MIRRISPDSAAKRPSTGDGPVRRAGLRAAFLCPVLCALLAAGCAGSRGYAHPYVEARDAVFVDIPSVPAAVDSLLSPLGWPPGRFAAELRKELRFQLGRKGVSTPEDSAGAPARLRVRLDQYGTAGYSGTAQLTTSAGERKIPFGKKAKREEDREDPTVDNIRSIAGNLSEAARLDPRRGRNESGSAIPATLLML